MLVQKILLPAVLAPALAALVVACLFDFVVRRLRQGWERAVGSWCLAAGFGVAYLAALGLPRFPPISSTQRTFFIVLGFLVVRAVAGRIRRESVKLLVVALSFAVALRLLLRSRIENTWSTSESILSLAVLGAGVLVAYLALRAAKRTSAEGRERAGGVVQLMLDAGLAGAAAIALGLSGSALLGQLAAALAVAVLAAGIYCHFRKTSFFGEDDVPLFVVALGAVVLGGYFFAELSLGVVLLLLGAALARGLRSERLAATSSSVLLVAAVAWAGWQFLQREPDVPYYASKTLEAPALASATTLEDLR